MPPVRRLTVYRLLKILKDEEYIVVYKKWVGKNSYFLGECDYQKKHIVINYRQIYKISRTEKRTLFLHELLHAYFDIKLDSFLSVDDQEVVVDALAQHLCDNASKKQLEYLDNVIDKSLKKADNQIRKIRSEQAGK